MTAWWLALLRLTQGIDAANRCLAMIVRWGLLANAFLIEGNAVVRKVFRVASSTMYDVQPHFFGAAVLLMAAYALQRDEHVRIDVFAGVLGPRRLAWLDLGGFMLVLLPLCIVAVWVPGPSSCGPLPPARRGAAARA